jgi:hypothetical protein
MSNTQVYKWLRPATIIGGLLLSACDKASIRLPTELIASQIVMSGGDNQAGAAGSWLSNPLAVRVTDKDARGVAGMTVHWEITSGAGDFRSFPETQLLIQPYSVTNFDGVARVLLQPLVPGRTIVAASVAGLQGSPVTFNATVRDPVVQPAAVIRFGPLFDCTPLNDPSIFPSEAVTVSVGATVEWVYMDWLFSSCRARIVSSSVPPGGKPFDSGDLAPGQSFQFVPEVAGTWEFTDTINGGTGTLTAKVP